MKEKWLDIGFCEKGKYSYLLSNYGVMRRFREETTGSKNRKLKNIT